MGYTQHLLAEETGISEMYLSEIERGLKMPSMNIFIKIVLALEVSADYVLRDELPSARKYIDEEISERLKNLTPHQRRAAIDILDAYVRNI